MTNPNATEERNPLEGRHASTVAIFRWFAYEHLREGTPQEISKACGNLALEAIRRFPDDPELTTGLRKLLEAKDCFVRAAIAAGESS